MATSPAYIAFVCEQLSGLGAVRSRKMFGEYMVYVNDKPVLTVCDNTVFVKMCPELQTLMAQAETGRPYPQAKEHYILDIDNAEFSRQIVTILEAVTPVPKKRTKK